METGCKMTTQQEMIAKIARSIPAGEMVEILNKTSAGFHWRSSLLGDWFIPLQAAKNLVKDWNEKTSVVLFFEAYFAGGATTGIPPQASAFVTPEKMWEIRAWLDSLEDALST